MIDLGVSLLTKCFNEKVSSWDKNVICTNEEVSMIVFPPEILFSNFVLHHVIMKNVEQIDDEMYFIYILMPKFCC